MMPEKLDSSIVLLRERIEQGMRGSADLILDEFELAGVKGLAFMFDGLVSNTQVSDFLLRPINRMAPPEADPEKLWEYLRSQFLFSSEQGIVETYEDLFTKAMSGFAMVMLDGVPRALSLGYQGFETRGVGEPAMEKNLRGSREGFTESNNTNTAMVRRRLKSPNLTVETVVLLSHKKPDGHINVKVEFGEGEGKVPLDNIAKRAETYKPKERVTYKMIKEYIEAKYGFKVHTAYIAEVKRDLGLPMYDAPNAVEELKQPRKHPTVEKVEAIKDALKHFEVI